MAFTSRVPDSHGWTNGVFPKMSHRFMAVLSDYWCCDMKNNSSYTAPLLHRWNPMAHIRHLPMSWLVLVPIFCTTPKCFSCWWNIPHSIPEFPQKYYTYIHISPWRFWRCEVDGPFFLGPGWTNQVDMNLPNLLPGQRSPCRWGFLSLVSSGILHWTTGVSGHSRTKPGFSTGTFGNMWVWINTYENTIFSGMNIHESQLWLGVNRRYQGLSPHPHVMLIRFWRGLLRFDPTHEIRDTQTPLATVISCKWVCW